MPGEPYSIDEPGRQPLHPAVDGDVVHGDAALGQQLLDIPAGQAIPQVSPHRDRDHLLREPKASEHRDEPDDVIARVSRPLRSANAVLPRSLSSIACLL
jgi:hypothetical protein